MAWGLPRRATDAERTERIPRIRPLVTLEREGVLGHVLLFPALFLLA